VDYYPLFETALRGADGRTLTDHRSMMGALWAGLAAAAADNPHATIRTAPGAVEIVTPSDRNRMIGFPYTKLLTSNIVVDMAASVILCSAQVAEALGIPRDRWVFPVAGASSADAWFVTDRVRLDTSPAIRANATSVFGAAGVGIDDVAHLDLYSCFPSAVQIAARELGLPVLGGDRPLTTTGGLTFAGGPGNNYSTHALASLVDRLRADPGSLGLLTANGMFSTKHALGLYSTQPPQSGFQHIEHGTISDGGRRTLTDFVGEATLETYVVKHGDNGMAEAACLVGLTADGSRVWGSTQSSENLRALEADELLGSPIRFDGAAAHLS
jgi:acetyl-CoA C-acetyltransferase